MKAIAYGDMVKKLSEYYDPIPSSIVQRYKFYNCSRKDRESIANFATVLREIAKFYDYIWGDTKYDAELGPFNMLH